jgi:general secretion pathway protein G
VRRRRTREGFTLVELLLVIIIIATLAAIVVPRFAGRSEEARVAKAKADIAILENQLDIYAQDNLDRYPTTEQGLRSLREQPTTPPVPKKWKGPYIKKGVPKDPWENDYKYVCPGKHNPSSYDLWSMGPDGQDGGDDDVTNWSEEG